jgi:hypothetical protein
MVFSASTMKYKTHPDDNDVENNIAYETTSKASSVEKIYWCGLLLMICYLQNSIIVKNIL